MMEEAEAKLAAGVFCFHCRERQAVSMLWIIVDMPGYGVPPDNCRVVAVGMCPVCQLLTSEDELLLAAKQLLASRTSASPRTEHSE